MIFSATPSFGQLTPPNSPTSLDSALVKCADCIGERKVLRAVVQNLYGIIDTQDQQLKIKGQVIANQHRIEDELNALVDNLNAIIKEQDKAIRRAKTRAFFKGLVTGGGGVGAIFAILLLL